MVQTGCLDRAYARNTGQCKREYEKKNQCELLTTLILIDMSRERYPDGVQMIDPSPESSMDFCPLSRRCKQKD